MHNIHIRSLTALNGHCDKSSEDIFIRIEIDLHHDLVWLDRPLVILLQTIKLPLTGLLIKY